jgi:hypothetical protein
MVPDFHSGLFRESWQLFDEKVIPRAASAAQRMAMKQAFLAGAFSYRAAFAAAFKNDWPDGRAIENMHALDDATDQMAREYMLENERIPTDMLGDGP